MTIVTIGALRIGPGHFVHQSGNICAILEEYSGRVLDLLRSRGRWFKPHRRRCVVSLSQTLKSLLNTGSTQKTTRHYGKKNCLLRHKKSTQCAILVEGSI